MLTTARPSRWSASAALYALLNPIPFGCFVAALAFDAIFSDSADVLWGKSAAWLLFFGLLAAIVPRLINLVHVWRPSNRVPAVEKWDFWLNLVAIVLAIVNSFVHSRDAYGPMPEGLVLSVITVALLAVGFVITSAPRATAYGADHA